MRYREPSYQIDTSQNLTRVFITVPESVIAAYPTITETEKRKVIEAIRLISDETAHVVFCSTMQKDNIVDVVAQNNQDGTTELGMLFATPAGKTIETTDMVTIEMDWGESPEELKGNLVTASVAEYAAFKSHMETEIANILTPITEE